MRSQLRLFRRGFGGDHFCGFVAVPIIVASSFWLPGLSTDGNVCGWASNHQDYRRSPSDYSKLAFPSYSWPRLDSLVLISLTATSTPDWPPQTSLIFCQMQVSMIPMVKALLQWNIAPPLHRNCREIIFESYLISCYFTSLYTVNFPDRIAEGLHFVLIYWNITATVLNNSVFHQSTIQKLKRQIRCTHWKIKVKNRSNR